MNFSRLNQIFPLVISVLFFQACSDPKVPLGLQKEPTSPEEIAKKIHSRLTGVNPSLADRNRMRDLIVAGDMKGAVRIAMSKQDFLINELTDSKKLRTENENFSVDMTEGDALRIALIRDRAAQHLELTGGDLTVRCRPGLALNNQQEQINPSSRNDNEPEACEEAMREGRATPDDLIYITQTSTDDQTRNTNCRADQRAGILTVVGYAGTDDGTNRLAMKMTIERVIANIPDMAEVAVDHPDDKVARDVDRAPGGDPSVYEDKCKRCHAGMDRARGAFAHHDGTGNIDCTNGVQNKYNRNGNIFPPGFVTTDDSFSFEAWKDDPRFGFRGAISGNGVQDFANIVARSLGYSRSYVQRAVRKLCLLNKEDQDTGLVEKLRHEFEQSPEPYAVQKLYEKVAESYTDCF